MIRTILTGVACTLMSSVVWAQSVTTDHPMVSRYPNTELVKGFDGEYLEYPIAQSSIDENDVLKTQKIRGKLSHRLYEGNEEESILVAQESILKALSSDGFSISYQCTNAQCGGDIVHALFADSSIKSNYIAVQQPGPGYNDFHYIAAQRPMHGTTMHLVYFLYKYRGNSLYIAQDIIETEAISLKEINFGTIETSGKLVLDGIYFKTDSNELTSESKPALEAIAKFLNDRPTQTFFVVGHTDSHGTLQHNLTLSSNRAKAVVTALVETHKVSIKQLLAQGVGPLSPKSTNVADVGRALNRRVELVVNKPQR